MLHGTFHTHAIVPVIVAGLLMLPVARLRSMETDGASARLRSAVAGGASARQAAAAQEKPDKNSVELIVRGCLKGREVTADEISGSDDLANEIGMIFRLSAKGDLSDEIKRRNGQRVMVTGLVKKTALAKPGLQLGGGRVVIGGGPVAQDPTRNPARNPSRRMVPMDASAMEVVAESCRSAGPRQD